MDTNSRSESQEVAPPGRRRRKREEDESQFMRVGYAHQSKVEHKEPAHDEEPAHDTGRAAAGDAGTKRKSTIQLSNKLMFALD